MSSREPAVSIAPSGTQYEITHREQRAVIVEVGGGLRGYSVAGRGLLDGYGVDDDMPFGSRPGTDPVAEPAAGRPLHPCGRHITSSPSPSRSGGTRFTASFAGPPGPPASSRQTES